MDDQLLQLLGSLAAILALAAIAWALKLGQGPVVADAEEAFGLAREADTGFDPAEAMVSQDGATAILADAKGRIMVLKRHGTHFAARLLEPGAQAACSNGILLVTPADRRFGAVRLDLGEQAQAWESRVNALG